MMLADILPSLAEGKAFRRASWEEGAYIQMGCNPGVVSIFRKMSGGLFERPYLLKDKDILADDWSVCWDDMDEERFEDEGYEEESL